MSLRVPDLIGEVVGYRAWRVDSPGYEPARLLSIFNDTVWPTDAWTVATCALSGPVPHPEPCGCGIYAARDRGHLMRQGYHDDEVNVIAVGEVGLAGDVIPGERGWRAERARPIRLWLPYEHWPYVKPLRLAYRIPVGLSNILRKGASGGHRA